MRRAVVTLRSPSQFFFVPGLPFAWTFFAAADFGGVIERCAAVLMVVQSLPGVAGLETRTGVFQSGGDVLDFGDGSGPSIVGLKPGQVIAADERLLFAGCRVWCLVRAGKALPLFKANQKLSLIHI